MDNKLLGKVGKGLASTIVASLLVFSQTGVSEAAEVTKKVEINPQIKILNNGLLVPGSNVAPIIIDGTTYLPVRSLSTVLNKNVLWEGLSKSIFITDNVDPNEAKNEIANLENFIKRKDTKISELEGTIKTKDTKITDLENSGRTKDAKVVELENLGKTKDAKILELENAIKAKDARIAELERNPYTNTSLKNLQDQLNNNYQRYWNGFNLYITLREDRNGINVEIETDLRYANDYNNWYNITNEEYLNFVNRITNDIWYNYNRNTNITGTVTNTSDRYTTLATFSADNRNPVQYNKYPR